MVGVVRLKRKLILYYRKTDGQPNNTYVRPPQPHTTLIQSSQITTGTNFISFYKKNMFQITYIEPVGDFYRFFIVNNMVGLTVNRQIGPVQRVVNFGIKFLTYSVIPRFAYLEIF